jgi:hypothetical protein
VQRRGRVSSKSRRGNGGEIGDSRAFFLLSLKIILPRAFIFSGPPWNPAKKKCRRPEEIKKPARDFFRVFRGEIPFS